MSEVRATSGAPVSANFAGFGAPTVCAPLGVNSATGDVYSLKNGTTVVVAGGVVTSGTAAPNTTPAYVGQFYVDTNASKLYFSKGTGSSADWIAAN